MASGSACAPRPAEKSSVRGAARGASGLPCDGDLGLPRDARLRRRREFQKVYDRGVRVAGQHMVVFALECDSDGARSRLGVTASRRVGGAVARARCKRRLRELFRLHPGDRPGNRVDLVLNARASCAEAAWYELVRDYRDCMRRLKGRLARR